LSRDSDEKNNTASARPIRAIGVLGAGTMGHGIAQVAAAAGYTVVLRDVNAEALARGVQSIERNLSKAIQLGKIVEQQRDETLQRIHGATRFDEIRDVDLVIEAAPENLELKQSLLRELEALVDTNCIFATNTSSLSIGEIASAASRPENVVGMHFFNPVHIMRLVEIIVGANQRQRYRECARSRHADEEGTDHRARRARICIEPPGRDAGLRSDANG